MKSEPLTPYENKGLRLRSIVPVLLICFLIGLYFAIRFDGLWTESDTSVITATIRSVIQTRTINPGEGIYYRNGYGYQGIVAVITLITGVDPADLQQLYLPFAIIFLAAPAIALFYEITGSRRLAVLGSILLFTQPEVLFVVLRGSHEKFGRLFMTLALLLLFRSFKSRGRLGNYAVYVGLFYLVLYSLLSLNFLISFSFVFALAFGLGAGALLERFRIHRSEMVESTTRRLALVVPLAFILAFLLVFYIYPPIQAWIRTLGSAYLQTRALLLGDEPPTNIYNAVLDSWVTPGVYVFVSLPNWLMMAGSLAVWIYQGIQWVSRRQPPNSRAAWLLWLLYGAFGFQAVLSIITDASGAFGNLQYRLFPTFVLLGVGMLITILGPRLEHLPRSFINRAAAGLVIFMLAFLSLVKATNEPALVNHWFFYRPPEVSALWWFDSHAGDELLWVGPSNRLNEVYLLGRTGESTHWSVFWQDIEDEPNILLSSLSYQLSARTGLTLPDVHAYSLFYDNGTTQMYHRRPVSPYQR
jgi:hypothetical protein